MRSNYSVSFLLTHVVYIVYKYRSINILRSWCLPARPFWPHFQWASNWNLLSLHNFSFSFVLDVLLMLNTVGCLACCWIGLVKTGTETANSQNYKQILANLRYIRQNKFNTRSYWFWFSFKLLFRESETVLLLVQSAVSVQLYTPYGYICLIIKLCSCFSTNFA